MAPEGSLEGSLNVGEPEGFEIVGGEVGLLEG